MNNARPVVRKLGINCSYWSVDACVLITIILEPVSWLNSLVAGIFGMNLKSYLEEHVVLFFTS